MADAIARLVDERVEVTILGADLIEPLVTRAETAATGAEASATAAEASAAAAAADALQTEADRLAAAASEANALSYASTASAAQQAVLDAIDDLPAEATLPLQAVSRTALAAFTGMTLGRQAILTEAGREGLFVWSNLDLSDEVTGDPFQGIYVPPTSDTTGASGAWVRVIRNRIGFVDWFGPVKNGTADDSPKIRAALLSPLIQTAMLGSGTYGVASTIYVPGEKSLRGVHRDATILKGLAWADWSHNRVITGGTDTEDYFINGMQVSDLTIDGAKVGMGGGTGNRLTLFAPTGTNFLIERCRGKDSTGYQFYARGEDPIDRRAGGVFRDCLGENGDTIFETTYADGVLYDNCHATSGDGDLPCEAAMIAWAGSDNVTFRNCSFIGSAGNGVAVIANDREQKNIVFDNVYVEVTGTVAFSATGIGPNGDGIPLRRADIRMINSRFFTTGESAVYSGYCDIIATGCHFRGGIGYKAGAGATMLANGCIGEGISAGPPSYGMYLEGGAGKDQIWNGGKLIATGNALSVPFSGGVISDDTVLVPLQQSRYDFGTPVAITAATGATSEDYGSGWYRLTKTTTDATTSDAYSASASLPGPFLLTVIPHAVDEAAFGITDAGVVTAPSTLDAGFWLRPAALTQASGASLEDQLSRPLRPLHLVRDSANNIYFYAGGETEKQGKLIKTITVADHGGALSGPFKAAFWLTEQNQVLDVRVAKYS